MAEWFKRFTISLFSDGRAKESVKFGFGNILLTSVLAFVFIFLGIFAGKTVPFASYYNGADDFRSFLYNVFSKGISVNVKDDRAVISLNGENTEINTVENEEDGALYSKNGYHLFVNSANVAETFDDFEAYCVNTDGKTEIDYEKYLSLNETERKNYRFAVRYTGKIKRITADVADACAAYLKGLNDGDISSKLTEIEGAEKYAENVYALYVQTYYPDIVKVTGETVPTLRNYYYLQTLKTEGKYMCLFGDMFVASFDTYNRNTVTFGGLYKSGNSLTDGSDARSVDSFIKNAFYGSASFTFLLDLLNGISVIAFTELITVAAMLLGFAVCRLRNKGACLKFADSARIVASYAHMAALLSAVATLLLSFAFGGIAVSIIAYVCFATLLTVRTLVLIFREKQQEEPQ